MQMITTYADDYVICRWWYVKNEKYGTMTSHIGAIEWRDDHSNDYGMHLIDNQPNIIVRPLKFV